MSRILLLTDSQQVSTEVVPALGLLAHQVRVLPAEAGALVDAPPFDALMVDGRRDLVTIRGLCRVIRAAGIDQPLVLICTEGGLAGVNHEWGLDDFVLDTCGPAELEARLRLLSARPDSQGEAPHGVIRRGGLTVDEETYVARLSERTLDLTFKEFELLKYLAQHPGRVFTRAQLLQDVWGYDYYGGTRTVDVHVRRLRAKLGPENEHLIGTVRNVGYRFVSPQDDETES